MIYTLTQISNLRLENKKKKLDIEEQEKRLKHPNQDANHPDGDGRTMSENTAKRHL